MRQEIEEWLMSIGTPTALGISAVLAVTGPLAVEAVDVIANPDLSERLLDRLAGPAGTAIFATIAFFFIFRQNQAQFQALREEATRKDEIIKSQAETIRTLAERKD